MDTVTNEEIVKLCESIIYFSETNTEACDAARKILGKIYPKESLKKINVYSLNQRIPLRVWDSRDVPHDIYPDENGELTDPRNVKKTSLKTDKWVFNDKGFNPWPDGCIVVVTFTSGNIRVGSPKNWRWEKDFSNHIISSMFLSPATGWME